MRPASEAATVYSMSCSLVMGFRKSKLTSAQLL